MNNEHMPRYVYAHMGGEGELLVTDPEQYTHKDQDMKYVRVDMLFEALADKGYHIQIIITPKGEDIE